MRTLWRLGTRNWSASPGRTAAVVLSVALGVGTVVVITDFYETTRRAITDEVVSRWLGTSHVTVHPIGAHWGSLDASLAEAIRKLDNVRYVTARLRRPARLIALGEAHKLLERDWLLVDAIGIEPQTEQHFHTLPDVDGRMIQPGERGVAVVERDTAHAWHLTIGDRFLLTPYGGGPKTELKVVGLFNGERLAAFQRPRIYLSLADAQALKHEPGIASVIDVMLYDASPSALAQAKSAIEHCIAERHFPLPYRVETAAARELVLSEAERITRVTLMLMAFIALLTSFFIILTTQSISLVQRRRDLGTMRCLGLTRWQLGAVLSFELIPLGVIGTVIGILGGLGTTRLVAALMSDVFIHVYTSPWGLQLAVLSGLVATLLGTLLLVVQVGRIAPLEAVYTQAKPVAMRYVYAVSVVGLFLLGLHQWMVYAVAPTRWLNMLFSMAGAVSQHLGYVLLAPAVVVILGRPIARGVGWSLGLRAKLAEGPFVRAPWRTTGACWVLMVGLSLIVYVATRAQGVLAIWDFPAKLPEAFVWSQEYVPGDVIERVQRLPGVGATTISTDVPCVIKTESTPQSGHGSIVEAFLSRLTKPVFVAGDPEKLLRMVKVAFTEGSRDDAMKKLRQGGYVLIPPQTARNHKLHVGDRLTVTVNGRSAKFEVAGVIQSPAMDLAVTALQAESYMQFAAANAILGTREDLKNKFGLDTVSMFMCDVELPPSPVAPGFDPRHLPDHTDREVARAILAWRDYLPNERETMERIVPRLIAWNRADSNSGTPALPPEVRRELLRYAKATEWLEWSLQTKRQTREENWTAFRERLLLLKIAQTMNRPGAVIGSLRRLTNRLDRNLRHAMLALTWLPAVLLAMAALGIANLMMVSVYLRSRSIAVLRAVGAQKSQILRLVLAEAATIGLLGSVLGIALGLHEADSVNRITAGLIDVSLEYIIPIGTIGLAVLLTVVICLLAGLAPALHASRNNIISAMRTH